MFQKTLKRHLNVSLCFTYFGICLLFMSLNLWKYSQSFNWNLQISMQFWSTSYDTVNPKINCLWPIAFLSCYIKDCCTNSHFYCARTHIYIIVSHWFKRSGLFHENKDFLTLNYFNLSIFCIDQWYQYVRQKDCILCNIKGAVCRF